MIRVHHARQRSSSRYGRDEEVDITLPRAAVWSKHAVRSKGGIQKRLKRLVRESEKAAFPDEEEEVDVDNLPAHAPPKRPLKRLVRLSEKEPETATKPKGGIQSRLRQLVRESEKAAFPDEEEEVDVDNLPAHAPPKRPLKRLVRLSEKADTPAAPEKTAEKPAEKAPAAPEKTAEKPPEKAPEAPPDYSQWQMVLYDPSKPPTTVAVEPTPGAWPHPVRDTQYAQFVKRFFDGDVEGFLPPELRRPDEAGCDAPMGARKLAPQQAVVNLHLKKIASLSPHYPSRGFLAWHSTGSGKTCTAMGALDAFWDTKKNFVLATSKENKTNNSLEEIAKCATLYPRFKGKDPKTVLAELRKRVWNREIVTFTQLSHAIGVHKARKNFDTSVLNNALLVMDEVQNLFKPLPGQQEDHRALKEFLATQNTDTSQNLFMVILTATPGDSVAEILWLVNMIRPVNFPVFTMANITPDRVRGMISFVDYTGDTNSFPEIASMEEYDVPMSAKQFELYKARFKESRRDIPAKDRERYWYAEARKIANCVPLRSVPSNQLLRQLPVLSPKFQKMVEIFLKGGKHYVYSYFNVHGIADLAKVLSAIGYSRFTPGGPLPPRKRFAVLDGETTEGQLKAFREVFNSDANKRGELLQIVLARRRYNEGLDLKAVTDVHIMEPLVNANSEKQAIARAVRHCSHKALPKAEWKVRVHRYFAVPPGSSSSSRQVLDKIPADKVQMMRQMVQLKLDNVSKDLRKRSLAPNVRAALQLYKRIAEIQMGVLTGGGQGGTPSVDKLVYQDAKARGSNPDLERLLAILRDASIDCEFLKSFHNQPNMMRAANRPPLECKK
eukprot:jgi/Mesvir1/1394/Mv22577-RA.1